MAVCEVCGKSVTIKNKSYILNKERDVCSDCIIKLKKYNDFDYLSNFYFDHWDTVSFDIKASLLKNDLFRSKRFELLNNKICKNEIDGYWEYKVIDLVNQDGLVDTVSLSLVINDYSMDGWRVKTAHSNELGKNAMAIFGFGINSTAEQNIIILERFKRIKEN